MTGTLVNKHVVGLYTPFTTDTGGIGQVSACVNRNGQPRAEETHPIPRVFSAKNGLSSTGDRISDSSSWKSKKMITKTTTAQLRIQIAIWKH